MKAILYKTPATDPLVQKILYHFENGLRKKIVGLQVLSDSEYKPCDVAFMFGVYSEKYSELTLPRKIILEEQMSRNKPTVIIERGYARRNVEDGGYQGIGIDGPGGYGIYFRENMPDDRWKELNIEMEPKRENGDSILLLGQVPWDTSVQSVGDYLLWCENLVEKLRVITARRIVFRPHPLMKKIMPPIAGTILSEGTLEEDLARTKVCVTFSSTSSIEAVIKGVPVVALDRGAMVYSVAETDIINIETPYFPSNEERYQWACNLAYSQWNFDELDRGSFWPHLKKYLTND